MDVDPVLLGAPTFHVTRCKIVCWITWKPMGGKPPRYLRM